MTKRVMALAWIAHQLLFVHILTFVDAAYSDNRMMKKIKLVKVIVPTLVDKHEQMRLECHFDLGDEELNSVKWYKDENEFFRYMPIQKPAILQFPVNGVTVKRQASDVQCTNSQCSITLVNLTKTSGGEYKCEVSTDAPTFRVVFKAVNVTVAALPKNSPRIDGLKSSYSLGEMLNISCASDYSDPPSKLSWLINNKSPPPTSIIATSYKKMYEPTGTLISSKTTLQFMIDKRILATATTLAVEIRCISSIPEISEAPIQYTALSSTFRSTTSFLGNEKLEWYRNGAKAVTGDDKQLLVALPFLILLINGKLFHDLSQS